MMKLWIPSPILAAVVVLAGCASVPTAGTITTVAGTGERGYSGGGGPATEAQLQRPGSVAMDGGGTIYVGLLDRHVVVRVDANGIITKVAGTGTPGFSGDGGPASEAEISLFRVGVDTDGHLYIADHFARIRRIGDDGIITTVVGTGLPGFSGDGGPASEAEISEPHHVAFDRSGNLYISGHSNRIRKVDADGTISTVAGTGEAGFSGDGGPAAEAQLNGPMAAVVGPGGILFIADTENHRIRKVDASGIITTIAGTGTAGHSGDGEQATAAQLRNPTDLALDPAGNLHIADSDNHRIRKISPNGIITTIAGTGTPGFSGDGGPATQAQLRNPFSIFIDASGTLYIADTGNHRIRKVSF